MSVLTSDLSFLLSESSSTGLIPLISVPFHQLVRLL